MKSYMRTQKNHTMCAARGFAMPAVIILIVLVAMLAGAWYIASRRPQQTTQDQMGGIRDANTAQQAMGEKQKGDSVATSQYTGAILAGTSAPLLDFTKADYDAAVRLGNVIVLYFYAEWCPICKIEFPRMQAAFDELKTDKVIGFRVNYNDNQTDGSEKDLAKGFGVAYQHTKVILKDGKQLLKAPDGWDKARYLAEINKALAQ